ncbi:hypothetical protein [Parathalassolituus penaei]|uniref:Serine/threonine protein kinase n=1 Tax=Parathalassolituus penaei TaxID=2997323 RepID=A0A9X3IT59_9GAMM|nr:hypothetical protein [Parathalassolituus penaei]MCY0965960.1 hypothetical protein [Parathalassolituus penaei]
MEFKKKYLVAALLAATTASIVGCGGSSSSSNKDTGNTDTDTDTEVTYDFVTCNSDETVCTLEGTVDKDYTMKAGVEYRLNGFVTVGAGNVELADAAAVTAAKSAGVTLTIEPGVEVKAYNTGVLLVTRGSKLMAEGTAAAPITFSSVQDDNYDGLGEWGGVVIQGFAPQYGLGDTGVCYGTGTVCNVAGEGGDGIGYFGGNDMADNSGVMKYVRIAEAGKVAGPDNEINGLSLQGVGSGTTIDYIQIHNSLDDGIEWFGGNVNVTHAVLTNNDDDDIDFDEGFQGNIQYAIVLKNQSATATPSGTNDPRGIEGNSDLSSNKQVSATHAALSNITLIGGAINNGQPAAKLRGEVNADLSKVVATGFASGCLEVKSSEATNVSVQDMVCDSTDALLKNDSPATGSLISSAAAITLNAAGAVLNAEAVATSITADVTAVDNGSDFAFDATTYAGAVNPNGTDNWTSGWVIEGSLDTLTAVNQ